LEIEQLCLPFIEKLLFSVFSDKTSQALGEAVDLVTVSFEE